MDLEGREGGPQKENGERREKKGHTVKNIQSGVDGGRTRWTETGGKNVMKGKFGPRFILF